MIPIVLVHGGAFDHRCWDRVLPHLDGPALAVDLPGRGAHPMAWEDVTLAACAAAVGADVDAAGFDEIVLVGHSLAGCSMPSIIGVLDGRVRHAVFVAATVPEDGHSAFDMLDPSIQQLIVDFGGLEPRPMDPAMARLVLGDDLTEEELAWCAERMVAEAPGLTTEPVDLAPLRTAMPRTWVRTVRDLIVSADQQLAYARNAGDCDLVDLDVGHMCMVSEPAALARILNRIAVSSPAPGG